MFACKGIKAVYSGKISRLCTSGLFRRNLSAAKIAFPAVCCTCRTRFVSGHGLLFLPLRPGGCRAQMRRAEIVHRILICSCRAAKRHAGASSRDQTGRRGLSPFIVAPHRFERTLRTGARRASAAPAPPEEAPEPPCEQHRDRRSDRPYRIILPSHIRAT